MIRRLGPLLILAAGGSTLLTTSCATSAPPRDRAEILAVLQFQADAWNRGDLDAFVTGYRRSDQTVFAGGDKVHRGFDAMVRRYREAFPTRETMGRLTFSSIAFEHQDGDSAIVTGSWELELAGADKRPGGVFTLIWRRFVDGWKIVHDHTSSRN